MTGVQTCALPILEELEELRKQHEEQEIILDSIPAMIFYKDKEDRFVHVNKYLAEAVNIAKKELVGKTAAEISPTKDYWEDDKAVMASGEPLRNIIEPIETPEGTRWFQTDKIPYRDRAGNIIGIIGFAVDITERKKAEDDLKEKQRLNALLLDSLPHAADRKSTRLNSSHIPLSRMPSSA